MTEEDSFPWSVLLPTQLHARGDVLRGERRLMVAVLRDAVETFLKHRRGKGSGRRILDEIEQWFANSDPRDVFSFANICQVLGLDPASVWASLARHHVRPADGTTEE